ncbi:MAG: glutamine-synthetase adenylyltransferase, partial [Pseudomonadota bacterium]
MSFADRITQTPIPYDPVRAAQTVEAFADAPAPLRNLIAGAAGGSPYLAGLLAHEGSWLLAQPDPEAAQRAALDTLKDCTPAQLGSVLRQAKRRVALITALADLGGLWGLDEVMAALSDLADRALQLAVETLVQAAQEAGHLPPTDAQDGGLFILAMGKLGARELNYSSDIDLIVLF